MVQHGTASHNIASHSTGAPCVAQNPHGLTRLIRGWVTALLTTLLAAAGHTAAHSITHPGHTEAMSPVMLGLAFIIAGPICVAFAGRGFSARRTLTSVGASQIVFHLLYSITGSATGHVHAVHGGTTVMPDCHLLGITITGETLADTTMVGGHLVATVISVAMILHGEHLLYALAHRILWPSSRIILGAPVPVSAPATTPSFFTQFIPRPTDILVPVTRRGPPVLANASL